MRCCGFGLNASSSKASNNSIEGSSYDVATVILSSGSAYEIVHGIPDESENNGFKLNYSLKAVEAEPESQL